MHHFIWYHRLKVELGGTIFLIHSSQWQTHHIEWWCYQSIMHHLMAGCSICFKRINGVFICERSACKNCAINLDVIGTSPTTHFPIHSDNTNTTGNVINIIKFQCSHKIEMHNFLIFDGNKTSMGPVELFFVRVCWKYIFPLSIL